MSIIWAYVIFNIFVTILTYYLFRVAKWNIGSFKSKKTSKAKKTAEGVSSKVPKAQ
jgi:uncharacterized membrane protein